jgi:hypothetical protein
VVSFGDDGGIHAELAGLGSLVGTLGGPADRHHRPRRLTFWLILPIKKSCYNEEQIGLCTHGPELGTKVDQNARRIEGAQD